MSNTQKAAFFIIAGLVMLMGVVGGIEQCTDLLTYDGVYLGTFALVGFALMALGTSYANEVDA
jgi:hypothetical protein